MKKEKLSLKDKVEFVFILLLITFPVWFPLYLILTGK